MRIVVTGSLAYDYLMRFPGFFREHLIADAAEALSVSFLVESMRRMRGGVAGNIAYTMALLGTRPLVFSPAGQDFSGYRDWMERYGIDTSGIAEIADEFTASCFINTDRANHQLVAFYPGAMSYAREFSLHSLNLTSGDLVIISPTDPDAMTRYTDECRTAGVPFLFDPGKQTPRLSGEEIRRGLQGAAILVGNEYEFAMMSQKTGLSAEQLIASAPLTVVTRGGNGSQIYDNRRDTAPIDIPVAPISELRDPTGAGDAYLGGLVCGVSRGLPLPIAGRVAALASAYAIEHLGCQEHHYTISEFTQRYTATFGATPELDVLASARSTSMAG